jgi:hypothetical protein
MSSHLHAVTFDAHDPEALAAFWGGVLRREPRADPRGGVVLLPRDDSGFRVRFVQSDAERVDENRTHFDLTSSTDAEMAATIARALELGARLVDIGQLPEEGHEVLADPEGNAFCVIPAGNNFLADTDFIGAINHDGSQAVGYFWGRALGWPLVWDQDEETAIQSPLGGSKMSWGGPPVPPKTVPVRVRLELVVDAEGDHEHDMKAEVERLVALGASRLHAGTGSGTQVLLADPDGNEFSLQGPTQQDGQLAPVP